MAEIHPVGLPTGDEQQILLEAGSDPSLLQVQGEGASIELLTEVYHTIYPIHVAHLIIVPEMSYE